MTQARPPRLITGLRTLFGVLRIFSLICLFVSPLGFAPFSHIRARATIWPASSAQLITVASRDHSPQIQIEHARVRIDGAPEDGELGKLVRFVETPCTILSIAGLTVIFHLLWRLCRNVESREVFSHANVELLRKLGWAMVVFSIVTSALTYWHDERVAAYIAHHATGFSTAKMTFFELLLRVGLGGIIFGLMALVLAEVFRYGLDLKRDAELTV